MSVKEALINSSIQHNLTKKFYLFKILGILRATIRFMEKLYK